MTNAAPGSVLGDDCKLLYSTDVAASNGTFSGTLTEAGVVIEDNITRERVTAVSNCRGDAEKSTAVGKMTTGFTATLLLKRGTPGASFSALKSAWLANTLLHIALTTGTITDVGQYVTRLEGRITKWDEQRPEGDVVKVSIEFVRAIDSYYPTTDSVVA